MYVIVKHTSEGKCEVLPAVYTTINEAADNLYSLWFHEISKTKCTAQVSRFRYQVSIFEKDAKCFHHEYIVQELTFGETIFVEGRPVSR